MNSPEFLAHTRRGKLPFLEDGDVAIGESGAIVLHLADRYRERLELAPPPGSRERSEFHDAFFFVLTELDAALYVIRRHEGLPDVYGASPVACDAARGYFLRGLGEIERRLADGRTHLLGPRFGAADLVLHTCLAWAAFVGIELPRGLVAYRDRIAARPALARAMAVNFTPAALAALTGAGAGSGSARVAGELDPAGVPVHDAAGAAFARTEERQT
jgi:glutathione S-transferase